MPVYIIVVIIYAILVIMAYNEQRREIDAHKIILRGLGLRDWMIQLSKSRQISFEDQLSTFLGSQQCDSINFSLDFNEVGDIMKEMKFWIRVKNILIVKKIVKQKFISTLWDQTLHP